LKDTRLYLGYLKRGRNRGIVDMEFAGSRLKIYVPKESCYIILSISAIRCPNAKESALGKEVKNFVHDLIHQHDVEFDVITQDRSGTFIGNLWVNRKNLATTLLEEGYASILYGAVKDSEYASEYINAEEMAKKKKIPGRLWESWDEEAEAAKKKARAEETKETHKPKIEYIDVMVTEILDGSHFFVQIVGPDGEKLEDLMSALALQDPGEPYTPKVNEYVKAQFSADDTWYRAKVTGTTANGEFIVFYVDYGNSESLPVSRIRKLDPTFGESKLQGQAREARLAYVKVPGLDEDFGEEAAQFLREMVLGKTVMANVEFKDGNVFYLSLGDRESGVHVNAALLRQGLARVERVRGKYLQPLIEKLKEEESQARAHHSCIWEYGDPGSDDDEEPVKKKDAAAVPTKKEPAKKDGKAEPSKKDGKEEE